ncbi:cysteine proteinase inhibitor 5-like [Cucurbita pepo subsp. pepo]|uniref:cysteine proteinase inhibitor 5-like n=1 Tax=Cucurbita pepo subsp. pepo TaxID=3664 RepID=UPI000C9D765D|nr:cysteine proteinase inhibitor 5-like [Cucurbita pepo subsp. pepo]
MKSRSASLFLILLLPLLVVATARMGRLVGGWEKIKDVKDPHIQEIGKFAVSEYNKQSKGALEFKDVVKGESQVVSGTNYRLVIEAKKGESIGKYQALVWEKAWQHFMELTSFKPVAN